jgi:hypothetical protein
MMSAYFADHCCSTSVSREWKAKIDGFARSWPSLMHIRLDKSSPVLVSDPHPTRPVSSGRPTLTFAPPQTRPPTEIRLMPVDLDERVATFYIPFSFGINGIVRTAMLRRAYTLCAGQYERKPTSTARLHEPVRPSHRAPRHSLSALTLERRLPSRIMSNAQTAW